MHFICKGENPEKRAVVMAVKSEKDSSLKDLDRRGSLASFGAPWTAKQAENRRSAEKQGIAAQSITSRSAKENFGGSRKRSLRAKRA